MVVMKEKEEQTDYNDYYIGQNEQERKKAIQESGRKYETSSGTMRSKRRRKMKDGKKE